MSVAIILDASQKLGLGHFFRCLNLSHQFLKLGYHVSFFFHEFDTSLAPLLNEFNFAKYDNNDELIDLLNKGRFRLVIVDINKEARFNSYGRYYRFINRLKKECEIDCLAAFDDYNHQPADMDVCIIPYLNAGSYIKKSKKTKYLLGLKYMTFNPKFHDLHYSIRSQIREILVFMGGTDPFGFTEKAVNCLSKIEDQKWNITILTGENSRLEAEDFRDYENDLNLTFVKGTDDVPSFMLKADIGIVNSGLVKYEAAYIGLPMIMISNEEAHVQIMEDFARKTLNPYLGLGHELNCNNFYKALSQMRFEQRKNIQEATTNLFGKDRNLLIKDLTKSHS